MINFDAIARENIKENNQNWPINQINIIQIT